MLYEEATSLYLSDSSNNGTSQSCLDQSPCIRVPSSPRWHGNAWKQELTRGRATDRSPNAQEEIGKGEWKAASMIRSLPPGLAGRQAGDDADACQATPTVPQRQLILLLINTRFSFWWSSPLSLPSEVETAGLLGKGGGGGISHDLVRGPLFMRISSCQ